MTHATAYKHVMVNQSGMLVIEGTTMKVVVPVFETHAYGRSPHELQFQHPYLTLGQIHSALSYYWDHRDDIDHDTEHRLERVEQIHCDIGPSHLVERLKAKGLLPQYRSHFIR